MAKREPQPIPEVMVRALSRRCWRCDADLSSDDVPSFAFNVCALNLPLYYSVDLCSACDVFVNDTFLDILKVPQRKKRATLDREWEARLSPPSPERTE